jgi:cobalt-zinc-cadmium efflux system protein
MSSHTHDHSHPHEHGHDHHHDHATGTSDARLKAAFAITALFMVVEVIGGIYSGSLALIADAGHMLTDAGALGLALYAAAVSRRPADALRTYGYGRARVLAAFVNGILVLGVAVWIAIEAVRRVAQPLPILAGTMLVVASAGLAVNVIAYFILSGGRDLNTRAALIHVIGDLLASVAAIAAALIILATGWVLADPLLSVVVAILIFRSGWLISRESAHALLEGSAMSFDTQRIVDVVRAAVPAVRDVHHVHSWTVGPDQPHVTLHVRVQAGTSPDQVILSVSQALAAGVGVSHVTVQVEFDECGDPSH